VYAGALHADLGVQGTGVLCARTGGSAPGPPYRPERPRPQTPDGL